MKRDNLKKWISILVIISCIVSGMCFANSETDSFFRYAKNSQVTSTIETPDKSIPRQEQCREEYLGIRTVNSTIRATTRTETKSAIRARILLSAVEILPQKFNFLHSVTAEEEALEEHQSSAVIIMYIHQQDGEKA